MARRRRLAGMCRVRLLGVTGRRWIPGRRPKSSRWRLAVARAGAIPRRHLSVSRRVAWLHLPVAPRHLDIAGRCLGKGRRRLARVPVSWRYGAQPWRRLRREAVLRRVARAAAAAIAVAGQQGEHAS